MLERIVGFAVACALPLSLPLSLLLFLQWPLREWLQVGSREANDIAQILFAFYVAVAVSFATRRGAHLAADAFAHRYASRTRATLNRVCAFFVLIPWSAFVLWTAWPIVSQSVLQLENFPETFNPGYFLIKASVAILALLVLLQAMIDVLRSPRT